MKQLKWWFLQSIEKLACILHHLSMKHDCVISILLSLFEVKYNKKRKWFSIKVLTVVLLNDKISFPFSKKSFLHWAMYKLCDYTTYTHNWKYKRKTKYIPFPSNVDLFSWWNSLCPGQYQFPGDHHLGKFSISTPHGSQGPHKNTTNPDYRPFSYHEML